MSSTTPEILKALLGKSADLGKLSPDAKKLLDTIQSGLQSDVFTHFFSEYEKLNKIGLTPADLKQYFDEWYTDAVSIINDAGVQLFINEQHTKIFGYSASELVGHDTYGTLFPDEFKPTIKAKSELRRRGISDVYEARMYRKNRELIDVRITGKPLFNSAGIYIGAIAIIEDITRERELEDRLRRTNEELEAKVQKRTRELTISNYQMVNEIKERKLAEIAVKNSEKRFRDLFYSSPEGVFVEDFEGNIYDLNEAAAKLHGYQREELIGQNVRKFSPEEDQNAYQMRQEQLTLGTIGSFEARIRHRDGHLIPVAVRTAVIEYNDKPALLLHARDITDRIRYQETLKEMNVQLEQKVKQRTEELENLNTTLQKEVSYRKEAEKAIEQQKDFLRLLIDMNPNLIFVRDIEGKYVLVNEAFAYFNHTTPKEMIGHYIEDFHHDKAQAKVFEEEDRRIALYGETIQQSDQKMHHRGLNKDIYVQLVKRPIPSLDSTGQNILGIITDITEIRTAEEKLKQSEQLYRQIARNVPNSAIFIYDKDLRYVLAEGSLIGVISPPKEEVEGRTIYEITDRDLIPARESRYKNILLGNSQVEQFEEGDKTLLTNALPIKDDLGNIIYGMVIILDITDLTKAQKELEEKASTLKRSNEELERFAYVASHDLQGPLRTITSYLQLLEQRYFQDLGADAKDFISFSVSGAKRMQQLITDLLNYSRLNSVPRPYQNVNLNELMFVVNKNLESTIEAKGATIECSNLPTIFAEQYQLTQMMQNLIDNAMKFIPADRKPLIRVTCDEDIDYWKISVSDNGIGIKDEFKDKVFQIFQRLHTDNEYPGTGIGLAICKKVADLHDGRIWFDSEYGQGTTFHVTISKFLKNKM
ncbi:MAG: PAS domain S-box protein [Bacteroidetes bacterium]|nr:PAS domain S-box protein [Bacteroidota bacterium]